MCTLSKNYKFTGVHLTFSRAILRNGLIPVFFFFLRNGQTPKYSRKSSFSHSIYVLLRFKSVFLHSLPGPITEARHMTQ